MSKLTELLQAISMFIISVGLGGFFIFLTIVLVKDHLL
jgi:hypothetical protein